MVLLIILTGGLHLDGFADVCDGFYAGQTKADALRIMKDPHLGTMAVVGIISVLTMKVALLSHLPAVLLCSAVLIFQRSAGVAWCGACGWPPMRVQKGGRAKHFFRTLGRRQVWIATILLGVWAALFAGWSAFLLLGLAAAATRLFVGYCNRRIGGMTGDTLGALNELLEILTLALYYPLSRWHMSPGPLVSPRLFW